jgi:hypothetical protein
LELVKYPVQVGVEGESSAGKVRCKREHVRELSRSWV